MKLIVEIKNVYGNEHIYPVNETAKLFTQLLRRKTLLKSDLKIIKELGFTIELAGQTIDL